MRLLWIFVGLAVLFLIPFLIWGGSFEEWLSAEGAVAWLRGYGAWAWLAGMILLALDIVLPIPGTVVMSALGLVYGAFLGGLISTTGSVLSGLLAYGACRTFGHAAAERITGAESLAKAEHLFAKRGGWVVALSRWLPLMPEVVACLAGLTRMRFGVFLAALVCGSAPLGFAFAAVGAAGKKDILLALALSAALPVALWLVVRFAMVKLGERSSTGA